MAQWGLPGSAVLAASVFVGGAVSSPLVAPGECLVRVGTPGELGLRTEGSQGPDGSGPVEPTAPPRPELRAPCSATGSGSEHLGVPGWPGQGAARCTARVSPHPPAGSRLPSPAASKNGGTPNSDSSGCRFPGAPSPQPWTPFYCPGPQRPHQPKILTTGTGFCFTASFLAVFSSFLFIMFKTLRMPVSAGGYGFF